MATRCGIFAVGLVVAEVMSGAAAWSAPPAAIAPAVDAPQPQVVPSPVVPFSQMPPPASSSQAATADPSAQGASPPVVAPEGIAVLALGGAADAAWPLAQQVYSEPSLRPAHIDEARARILCGEAPQADDPIDLRDLSETVAAVHGDDAASRALLAEIARRIGVRALVVVRTAGTGRPVAQVFFADTAAFDAATYQPDATQGASWSGAVRSLIRTLGTPPVPAPVLATHPTPGHAEAESHSNARPFYGSPWFWAALGLAAVAGGAAYFAARDSATPTIHLEVEVPHQ